MRQEGQQKKACREPRTFCCGSVLTTLDRKDGFGTYGCMRILAWTYGAIWAALCWPLDACAAEHFLPDCAGQVVIAHARVARVGPDGALVLPDGRVLTLEGIRLPPPGFREQALTALR